ncbi:MAG: glycerate kinase [Candidatus Hydrogenedentota bacterium]
MRIVVAPDSFKECLTAREVADAMAAGARRAMPDASIDLIPMADGGEGTVDALVAAAGGEKVCVTVTGPCGEPVDAAYGVIDGGRTAVIEMAAASGLALVPPDRRDPRLTTTYGTGELIADALGAGIRRIIVGLGGSATNDGGAGMAQALGFRLLDAQGDDLDPGGAALMRLATIDPSGRLGGLDESEILVACDVDNPLCGPRGASRTYGPQKGAHEFAVQELDAALHHFGKCIEKQLGKPVLHAPGAGAAGGLGAGLIAFCGATLRPGVDLVADACNLRGRIHGADLVITGEGRIDGQSAHGKTPVGVARIAKEAGVPVLALAGALGEDASVVYNCGIDAVFAIGDRPMNLEEALVRARPLIAATTEAGVRLWAAARSTG